MLWACVYESSFKISAKNADSKYTPLQSRPHFKGYRFFAILINGSVHLLKPTIVRQGVLGVNKSIFIFSLSTNVYRCCEGSERHPVCFVSHTLTYMLCAGYFVCAQFGVYQNVLKQTDFYASAASIITESLCICGRNAWNRPPTLVKLGILGAGLLGGCYGGGAGLDLKFTGPAVVCWLSNGQKMNSPMGMPNVYLLCCIHFALARL